MNLAVLSALQNSDFENFLVAATLGGIEAQEKRGQEDLCNGTKARLPIDGAIAEQSKYEAMGIQFDKRSDDPSEIFIGVTLPTGWQITPTEHSMWSNLTDDKSRERASIFYKAAFYDRSAHVRLNNRYSYDAQPVGGWENGSGAGSQYQGVVTDCGKVIFRTMPTSAQPSYNQSDNTALTEWFTKRDGKSKEAEAWLNEQFPNWKDPLAYWD